MDSFIKHDMIKCRTVLVLLLFLAIPIVFLAILYRCSLLEARIRDELEYTGEFSSFYVVNMPSSEMNIVLYQTSDMVGCSVFDEKPFYKKQGVGLYIPINGTILLDDNQDILSAGMGFSNDGKDYYVDFGAIINPQVRSVSYNGKPETILRGTEGYPMFFSCEEKKENGIIPHEILCWE